MKPITERSEETLHTEFGKMLQNAMDRLKPEEAQVLLLRYEFGYTDVEIAEMRGRSRISVAVTLTRARRRLEKLMEKEMGGER